MSVTIPTVQQYTDRNTVLRVQTALVSRGINVGALDGVMGPKTAAGIRAWQKSAAIPETGVIDYGVLLGLGVPVPGAAPAQAAVQREFDAQEAYRKAKATAPTAAPTASARPTGEAPLVTLPSQLDPAAPIDAGRPWWQYALVATAIGAIGYGGFLLVKKKGRR